MTIASPGVKVQPQTVLAKLQSLCITLKLVPAMKMNPLTYPRCSVVFVRFNFMLF